jgi:hypothetical protein
MKPTPLQVPDTTVKFGSVTIRSLAELQERFQRHLVPADQAAHADIAGPDDAYRQARLGIYFRAYRLRLIATLATDYPALQSFLNDGRFEQLANAYIEAHPSMSRNLRWFGRSLPDFLRSDRRFSNQPILGELAEFEWAQGLAFDAPDAGQLDFETLASVPATQWPYLCFLPHPSLHLVESRWNVVAIWHAHRNETSLPAATSQQQCGTIAVWRKDFKTYFRTLEDDEARLWRILADGAGFSEACSRLAEQMDEDDAGAAQRAAGLLRCWVNDGWIEKVDYAPASG